MAASSTAASTLFLASLSLVGQGCGSDDAAPSSDAPAALNNSTESAPGSSSAGSSSAGSRDTGTVGVPSTGDSAASTGGPAGPAPETTAPVVPGDCQVWELTYDLTGSVFEISDTPFAAGDQVNIVQEPYDADTHVGPGSFVIRFEDVGGVPGGLATLVSYDMTLDFVVGGVVTVASTLESGAGPSACGLTQGLLDGTTVAWDPPALVGFASSGEILCQGSLCSTADLPDGEPVPTGSTSDQPLTDFVFEEDLSAFTMAQWVVAADDNSTNAWAYTGTEVRRERIDAPACLCP